MTEADAGLDLRRDGARASVRLRGGEKPGTMAAVASGQR